MAKKAIVYYYRGMIERGAKYTWQSGYSATSENGGGLYPWKTRRECQKDAEAQGCRAVFKEEEDAKRE
jgi:hypothetical protein